LERRLDNVIHRLGFAPNRPSARQLVSHGHVLVNGKSCDIPSMLLGANDTVAIKSRPRGLKLVKLNLSENPPPAPDFLERLGVDPPEGKVSRLPTRTDVDPRINDVREQLIIEVCSR
jgi:small subunit ribosomal protein S4